MTESRDLTTVIADWRERANTLRACKRPDDAALVDEIVNDVARASEDFTTWLAESDAHLRSGKAVAWLRSRFPEWQESGYARRGRDGKREYLTCVVPQRAHLSAAREAGREAARRLRAS